LIYISQTSLIVSVFLSFIFSYSLISFGTLVIFLISIPIENGKTKSGVKGLLLQSKSQQIFGIASGLVDRVDRFLIGLILPIVFLAKYALVSSIISFARFLPDAAAKVYLFKYHGKDEAAKVRLSVRNVVQIVLSGIFLVAGTQGFIRILFGSEWLLPTSVVILLLSQEVLRGNYQLRASELITIGGNLEMSKISSLLIIASLLLVSLAVYAFGIWGAPLAMTFTYVVLTVLVAKKIREKEKF
jgi:O-antigen/teichoic acid export membrane protein